LETIVQPAKTAVSQVTAAMMYHLSGDRPKSVSVQMSPLSKAAPEGLGMPWK
jgi:hypothetical protein